VVKVTIEDFVISLCHAVKQKMTLNTEGKDMHERETTGSQQR